MALLKLTEPLTRVDTSRPVWVNHNNIAYFHEWVKDVYPEPVPGFKSVAVRLITTLIIFNAASAEDVISVNVLETPDHIERLIDVYA